VSDKVVLAYSGGLDTSVAIKWLKERYNLDIIALAVDVGNERDFSTIREKALKVGAVKALVADAKELFVNHFIFPALQADAIYEGQYPLDAALSRPLIAKLLVDTAVEEGASAGDLVQANTSSGGSAHGSSRTPHSILRPHRFSSIE